MLPFLFLLFFVDFVLLKLVIRVILLVLNAIIRNLLEVSQEPRLAVVLVSVSEILAQKVDFFPILFLFQFDILESLDVGPMSLDLILFELVHSGHCINLGDDPSTNLIEANFSREIFRLV